MSFVEVSRRIEQERHAKFCGTASIRVTSLHFEDSDAIGNQISKAPQVEALKRMFLEERGYRKEDNRYHAKAIISPHALEIALVRTGIQAERLRNGTEPYVELEIPANTRLECLQRYDRVAAAGEAFEGENKRWIVDLFQEDLSEELRRLFVEEYDYQKAPDDGKFYRKIREYQGIHGQKNQYFERLWLGQLSAVSRNRRDLFNQLKRHDAYLKAFDALLAIPALFCGFRLTVVHQMICMRCEEPNFRYLDHIHKTWKDICGGDTRLMQLVDKETIETLQGTAPGACSEDHSSLLGQLRGGRIFGKVSERERENIWTRICEVSRYTLIPSLHTFFEDLKFLKVAADCMRRLIHVGPRDTVVGRLEQIFTDANQDQDRCIIQVSDGTCTAISSGIGTRLDLGCRTLWLAAFRDYRDMPLEPRKKDLLAKPRKKADEMTLFFFASLAARLGFESEQIRDILQNVPDRKVAERTLLSVRRPGQYKYHNLEEKVQQMMRIFATAQPIVPVKSSDCMGINDCRKEPTRFGMPHDTQHDRDKVSLFLPMIYKNLESPLTHMTSFFVRRSVYFAFFGRSLPLGVDLQAHQCPSPFELVTLERMSVEGQSTDTLMETDPGDSANIEGDTQEQQDKVSLTLAQMAQQGANLQLLRQETEEERANLDNILRKQIEEQSKFDSLVSKAQAKIEELSAQETSHRTQIDELLAMERDQDEKIKSLELSLQMQQERLNQLTEQERQKQDILESLAERVEVEQEKLEQVSGERMRMRPELRTIMEVPEQETTGESQSEGGTNTELTSDVAAGRKGPVNTERGRRRVTQFEFGGLMNSPEDVPFADETQEVSITFKTRASDGKWIVCDELLVSPSDPSVVQRVAAKYVRKQFCLFDTQYHNLIPKTCFEKVTANGTNTILALPVSRSSNVGNKRGERQDETEIREKKRANNMSDRREEDD